MSEHCCLQFSSTLFELPLLYTELYQLEVEIAGGGYQILGRRILLIAEFVDQCRPSLLFSNFVSMEERGWYAEVVG